MSFWDVIADVGGSAMDTYRDVQREREERAYRDWLKRKQEKEWLLAKEKHDIWKGQQPPPEYWSEHWRGEIEKIPPSGYWPEYWRGETEKIPPPGYYEGVYKHEDWARKYERETAPPPEYVTKMRDLDKIIKESTAGATIKEKETDYSKIYDTAYDKYLKTLPTLSDKGVKPQEVYIYDTYGLQAFKKFIESKGISYDEYLEHQTDHIIKNYYGKVENAILNTILDPNIPRPVKEKLVEKFNKEQEKYHKELNVAGAGAVGSIQKTFDDWVEIAAALQSIGSQTRR